MSDVSIQEELPMFQTIRAKHKTSEEYSDRLFWFICPQLVDSTIQKPFVHTSYCESMSQGRGCKFKGSCEAYKKNKEATSNGNG